MNQKLFIKSIALRIGMLRNGWRTRRCLSPDMMQEAFAETANFRNLSSLGSRQAITDVPTSIKAALDWNSLITNIRLSRDKYLSNFDRPNSYLRPICGNKTKKVMDQLTNNPIN